jgi:hypothetical protein
MSNLSKVIHLKSLGMSINLEQEAYQSTLGEPTPKMRFVDSLNRIQKATASLPKYHFRLRTVKAGLIGPLRIKIVPLRECSSTCLAHGGTLKLDD